MWWQGFGDVTFPSECRRNIEAWEELNPGWEVKKWDEDLTMRWVASEHPQFLGLVRNLDKMIKKCDVARCLLMHTYGGLYADCDFSPRQPLSSLLGADSLYYREAYESSGNLLKDRTGVVEGAKNREPFSSSEVDTMVSYEWAKLKGRSMIANGFLLSRPGKRIWKRFVERSLPFRNSPVLDAFGPRRFTEYLSRVLWPAEKIVALPPMYCFWRSPCGARFDVDIGLAEHKFHCSWGDKMSEEPWRG